MWVKKQASITKEKYVARVFFSSPFGGLEEERELLTKQYWPELAHLCQKSGYEFVPVDMRWGITSELSNEAATITICLRELDRSDMIVGFFGQRYGWHGANDEFLQKTFDHALPRYPWLKSYRDRAVTELEFLHGHLNNPGQRPACFFFRDKAYDDAKLAECIAAGDKRGQRKFKATSDGPNAAEFLDDLKKRVKQTAEKCLAINMSYPTPEVGARLMFETVHAHLKCLLSQTEGESSEMEKEHAQHETFLITRRGMGGRLVGGEGYLEEIDRHAQNTGGGGDGGDMGKSLLLLGDAGELDLLKHLCYQIEEELITLRPDYEISDKKPKEGSEDVRGMRSLLQKLVHDASSFDIRVIIVIDALNKMDTGGRAMKELYWLPKISSSKVLLLLSTSNSDTRNIKELVDVRHFDTMEITQLTPDLRSKVTKGMLMVRGKELSPKQMEKVIGNAETGNPLYLFILLQELCSFGSFFELDDYINTLLTSTSTVDLFIKFLERLERDYNPGGKHLVKEVMCCLMLARRGLSENELKAIVKPTNKEWSALYFAMDDFVLEAEGLYRLAYSELGEAIKRYFCPTTERQKPYRQLIINHFMTSFQKLDQRFDTPVPHRISEELPWQLEKTGQLNELVECLSSMNMFSALSKGQSEYDLMSYWVSTKLDGGAIIERYLSAIDDQVALLYLENEQLGCASDETKTPAKQLIPLLVNLTDFLTNAGYNSSMEPMFLRAVNMHKSQYTKDDIENSVYALDTYCELQSKLACHYASAEKLEQASAIHVETLALREKHVDRVERGKSYIAVILNNLGYVCQVQHKYKEAEDYYRRTLKIHREVLGNNHDLVATTINNIGMALYRQGEFKESEKCLRESLQIYEEVYLGELPPDVGGTLLNLAMCIARQTDQGLADVEPLYKRALEIRVNAVGKNHPSVAQTYMSYGTYLMRVDQVEKAIDMTKDALKIFQIASGPEHQDTLLPMENIALGYIYLNKPEEAHPYYKKAGEALQKQGRMEFSHPHLNTCMITYYLQNDREADAHDALVRVIGTSFASARDYAALDYLDSTLPEKPVRPYEHSIDCGLVKYPTSTMLLGRKMSQLALLGKADEMVEVLEKGNFDAGTFNQAYAEFVNNDQRENGLKILERALEKFPDDIIIRENLAKGYFCHKRHAEAANVLKHALRLDEENLDLLMLRVRVLALDYQLQEAKDLIEVGLGIAQKKGALEAETQLENFLTLINESLGATQQ